MSNIPKKPENVNWNDKQWQAIFDSGKNIIVSASAGSGKTSVLVERIIKKIIDENNPINIDELLIVTFTNAAAAEMRERIRHTIEHLIIDNHKNVKHLKKQLLLLPQAYIMTFHSFCLSVIKRYYYKIDAEPNYRIGDEIEISLLEDEVLNDLLLSIYKKGLNEEIQVVEMFSSDRSDEGFKDIIRNTFKFARSQPNKNEWLDDLVEKYSIKESIEDWKYYHIFKQLVNAKIDGALNNLQKANSISSNIGANDKYCSTQYLIDKELIENIKNAVNTSYEDGYNAINKIKFDRFIFPRDYDPDVKELIQSYRDQAKSEISTLNKQYFAFKEKTHKMHFDFLRSQMSILVEFIKKYDELFRKAKQAKGIIDFSDLEELALLILSDENKADTDVAKQYQMQFKEILVDEYQDTNKMQEFIINLVSNKNCGNIFMVGDVKQSIYRFRSAEPDLFQEKFYEYSNESNDGKRIDLDYNYRSREEVINFVNLIFKQIMDRDFGEIDYDEDACLKFGASYYPNQLTTPKVVLLNNDSSKNETTIGNSVERAQLEAVYIANQINELINSGYLVFDSKSKAKRNIRFKDIVILRRSFSDEQVYTEVFKKANIPLYSSNTKGYFNTTEVNVIVSLLKVIDNPIQDIPLAAVLRSPIYKIDEEDLSNLRIFDRRDNLFNVVEKYILSHKNELSRKLQGFIDDLNHWREINKSVRISDLILNIYERTNYYNFVTGQYGGRQRQANLDALYNRAINYEEIVSNSIFSFVKFIEKLSERNLDLNEARTVTEDDDVVRLMSIHSSKGLEFPVVFLAGLSKQFNRADEKGKSIIHKKYGIALQYINLVERYKVDTIYQRVLKDIIHKEMLAEEMRLLYVALTRAKEKLFLVGTIKDLEKQVNNWGLIQSNMDILLPQSERNANCYFDWVMNSIARTVSLQDKYEMKSRSSITGITDLMNIDIEYIERLEYQENNINQIQDINNNNYEKYKQIFDANFNWSYPHVEATNHYAKQSITEIKARFIDNVYAENIFLTSHHRKPNFLNNNVKSNQIGTAIHLLMLHLPFEDNLTYDKIKQLGKNLVQKLIIDRDVEKNLPYDKILKFTKSDVFKQVQDAKTVFKELPFTMRVSSNEVYQDWSDSNSPILIQGVMDLVFETDDFVYLLDYKSDKVSDFEQEKKKLLKRYELQLKFYSKALVDIFPNKRVISILYFLDAGKFITIK